MKVGQDVVKCEVCNVKFIWRLMINERMICHLRSCIILSIAESCSSQAPRRPKNLISPVWPLENKSYPAGTNFHVYLPCILA
jgi:hypothetical protein